MPNAWIIALKKWNEGKDKWCMPRKGSKGHAEILKIMGKKKAEPKAKPGDEKLKRLVRELKRKGKLKQKKLESVSKLKRAELGEQIEENINIEINEAIINGSSLVKVQDIALKAQEKYDKRKAIKKKYSNEPKIFFQIVVYSLTRDKKIFQKLSKKIRNHLLDVKNLSYFKKDLFLLIF